MTPAARGKVPGYRVRSNAGAPGPYFVPLKHWRDYQLTEPDARWHTESGCNAGLILGPTSGLYALDLDISAPEVATVAIEAVMRMLGGPMPYRIGQWPKVAFLFRAPPGPGIRRVRHKLKDANGTEHLIELLGEGQQIVIAGTHPKTHAPYQWIIPGQHEPLTLPPAAA